MSRALILGAGVSGLAAARLCRRVGMSVSLYTEGLIAGQEAVEFGIATGEWDPELLHGIDVVVTSPGFPERSAPIVDALEWGVPIWSEIELAYRHLDTPIVAVTGTNGKTTVTEATSAMLETSGLAAPALGNIGRPLSDQVGESADVLVVEVSSFQLRFCEAFHPETAGITNVAPDHLDWHGSDHAYREAKARIFANQTTEDVLVYDADDAGASALAARAPSRLFPISITSAPEQGGGRVDGALEIGGMSVPIAELTSTDPVHLSNVAMAMALASQAGGSAEGIIDTAIGFEQGAHRRRLVAEVDGVAWVDDSKATNLHAATASVRSHDSVILIAGGLAKGQDVTPLALEPSVKALIGIGEAGPVLAAAAGARGRVAGTLQEAVGIAADMARAGDTVLLAPACASFDQFESYVERGDVFASLVTDVTGEKVG